MKRIKPIAGLLFLCGLCFCAFGATNASALTLGTLPLNTSTAVTPTLTETPAATTEVPETGGETAGLHAVLHMVAGGVSFQITCTGLTSANSKAENKEPSPGVMTFEGTGTLELSGCTAKTPTACTVPTTLNTRLLKQTTTGMSVVLEPAVAGPIMTIPISGASCPTFFKGNKDLTGKAVGTVEEATKSISFNSVSGNSLTFGGVSGAQFTAKIHFREGTTGPVLGATTP